jgi:hypothetical protein
MRKPQPGELEVTLTNSRILVVLSFLPLSQCLTSQAINAARGAPQEGWSYTIESVSVHEEVARLEIRSWQPIRSCSDDLDSSVHTRPGQYIHFSQCVSMIDGTHLDEAACNRNADEFTILARWDECCSHVEGGTVRRRRLDVNNTSFAYPEGAEGADRVFQTVIRTPQRPRPELWPFVPLMFVLDVVSAPFRLLGEIGRFLADPHKCSPLF